MEDTTKKHNPMFILEDEEFQQFVGSPEALPAWSEGLSRLFAVQPAMGRQRRVSGNSE